MARGGKREGAGRPAPFGVRVTLNARVSQETMDFLKANKGELSLGQFIDKIVKEYK